MPQRFRRVCDAHGVSEQQVRAALGYAAQTLAEERSLRFLLDENVPVRSVTFFAPKAMTY